MYSDIDRKPPLFIRITAFVFFFCFGVFIKNYFFDKRETDKEEVIKKEIDSINKNLPFVFEDFVRADSISLLKNGQLKYNFTFINVDSNSSKLFVDALKYKSKTQCQAYYETNEGMKPFIESNLIINYHYYDKNGKYLFDFTIKPNKKK
jgi:hypothetical protein